MLVVEPRGPLQATDLEALRSTTDAWLRTHDRIRGFVVHIRAFPGWDDFEAFRRHLEFVRDHHRRVRRIAIASDSPFATLLPLLAKRFVAAPMHHFPYAELSDAIAWAGA